MLIPLASWKEYIMLVRRCLKSLLLVNMRIVSIFWMSCPSPKCCSFNDEYLWVPYLSPFGYLEEYLIPAMTVGWMLLWMVSICWSLKHVDVKGYLVVGFMILLLVIAMSCILMFVDSILRAKFFVLEGTNWKGTDCFSSGWEVCPKYITGWSGWSYGTLILSLVSDDVIGIWNADVLSTIDVPSDWIVHWRM